MEVLVPTAIFSFAALEPEMAMDILEQIGVLLDRVDWVKAVFSAMSCMS